MLDYTKEQAKEFLELNLINPMSEKELKEIGDKLNKIVEGDRKKKKKKTFQIKTRFDLKRKNKKRKGGKIPSDPSKALLASRRKKYKADLKRKKKRTKNYDK